MSDKPGVVYVIENRSWPTWFKVGRAEGHKREAEDAMRRRLYQYNTGDPLRGYEVVAHDWAACCHEAERYAHNMLRLYFRRGNGEWFQGSPTLAKEIVEKACHVGRLAPDARPGRFMRLIEEMKNAMPDDDDTIEILAKIADIKMPSERPDVGHTTRAASAVIRDLLEMMAMPCENTEAAAAAVLRRLDALGEQ